MAAPIAPGAIHTFTEWCQSSLFTASIIEGTHLLHRAVDQYLIRLYLDLNIHTLAATPVSARRVVEQLHFDPSALRAVEAVLLRLSDNPDDIVRVEESGDETLFQASRLPVYDPGVLVDIRRTLARHGAGFVSALEFLAFGAEHFVLSLKDDPAFMDRVLTGRERAFAELWHQATNVDPMQNLHGQMGAKAVEMLFKRGTILELGGGTGSGISNNLQALSDANRLPSLEKYIFTDISMPFIMGTRHRIRAAFPAVQSEWRHLDINKAFDQQKILPDSADMIYGVNAAHIGKNTVSMLKFCQQTLKQGGLVVFSERVRQTATEMAPREIVLNLSKYHRSAAELDPRFRQTHAYLSLDNWRRAFQLAGFSQIEIWPDFDLTAAGFPNQYAAVIVAQV